MIEKHPFSFWIVLALILGVGSAAVYFSVKENFRTRVVRMEIDKLKSEAQKVDEMNLELREKIGYFQTQNFQEREAKDKLNLQKPEEQVVMIKPDPFQISEAPEVAGADDSKNNDHKKPDYRKWWNYFFGKDRNHEKKK